MIPLNSPHLKIEVIRKLLSILKEVPEYSLHEDDCPVMEYKDCNCLTSRLVQVVQAAELYLDTGDASKLLGL